jgi:carbamoyltransferase
MVNILGISAFYHDSAACLVRDGEIIAAAQEERFTRKKHDAGFPRHSIEYCLKSAGIQVEDLSFVVFYDKPLLKFDRLLRTYLAFAPQGLNSFLASMPLWLGGKLFLKRILREELLALASSGIKVLKAPILFTEHHEAHAASAFYPSPFERAAVLCVDGVGEWATTSAWIGDRENLTPLWEITFPHSLGLLYSAFTYYTGFRVNSGEYKVMGLAPYGEPKYVRTIYDHLLDLKADGSFRLNMDYFDFCTGDRMTNEKFDALFDGPPRQPESMLTQREMDLARSIQDVTEEVMLRLVRTLHKETGQTNLCLAGGVALNCVANGKIAREGPFQNIWIQPAAGDAGGAVGAALRAAYLRTDRRRSYTARDSMRGSFLGPDFGVCEVERFLQSMNAPFKRMGEDELYPAIARFMAEGMIVGWFQGRMEFGPRALGGRSILGDPRNPKMQSIMNLKIKYRESFRPFAPAVLHDRVGDYFDLNAESPYMLLVAPIRAERRFTLTPEQEALWGIDRVNTPRSEIPAVTHIDYSARIQTVHSETNPCFYKLLKAFEALTGCGVLVNTSFNVRGEPIVCTPEDAYRCFMRTEIDVLMLEDFVLEKTAQSQVLDETDWREEFTLD